MRLSEITKLVIDGAKKTGSYYATYPTKKEEHMTREDIIAMAREAGATPYTNRHYPDRPTHTFNPEALERFANLAAAAEREACARVVEQMGIKGYGTLGIAAIIRARGDK